MAKLHWSCTDDGDVDGKSDDVLEFDVFVDSKTNWRRGTGIHIEIKINMTIIYVIKTCHIVTFVYKK